MSTVITEIQSPFGENSIFHPSWDQKQKNQNQINEINNLNLEDSSIQANGVHIELVNSNLVEQVPNGYYYKKDGTFYGKHGNSEYVNICSTVEIKNGKNIYNVQYNTKIKHSDLIFLAATAIGESSFGYGVENKVEVYAISNAIVNYYKIIFKSKGPLKSSIKDMKAYAAINKNDIFTNFSNCSDKKRNYSFYKDAIGAALNALNEKSSYDFSNGATHWDGIDIQKNGKWKEGLQFQEKSADIFSIGDNKKPVKQKYGDGKYYERIYDYKWTATKGYYGINNKKINVYCPYFKDDIINKHKFGTVLMRLSDDYNKRLKYGEVKVE